MAAYNRLFTSVAPKCRGETNSDEIVVCARDQSRFRLPLRDDTLRADARSAIGGVNGDPGAPCPPRGCPGGATFLEAVGNLAKLGKAIIGANDDD